MRKKSPNPTTVVHGRIPADLWEMYADDGPLVAAKREETGCPTLKRWDVVVAVLADYARRKAAPTAQ